MVTLTRFISHLLRFLVQLPVPRWLRVPLYTVYSRFYGVQIEEAKKSLRDFGRFDDFFTRELREGLRPIGEGLVSPVDGTLRQCLPITTDLMLQVKGRHYSISSLLGEEECPSELLSGTAWHMYLSPGDYHRIHSPADGRITAALHIPGALFPVNDFMMRRKENLYAANERVVLQIASKDFGLLYLVLVAALNVGDIRVNCLPELGTNSSICPPRNMGRRAFDVNAPCERGDDIAAFHMGSSVLLFTQRPQQLFSNKLEGKILYGRSLLA